MLKFYLASTFVFKTFECILIPFKRGFGSTLKGMKVGLEGIREDEEIAIGLMKVGYQLQNAHTTLFLPLSLFQEILSRYLEVFSLVWK